MPAKRTQIIIERKSELLNIEPDDPDILYSVLCKIPQHLDLERLISSAITLRESHPPESIRSWRMISRYSVLKTARSAGEAASQTSNDGATFFRKQSSQLGLMELRQKARSLVLKYKRPIGTASLAILVGILSWWMSRNGRAGPPAGYGRFLPPSMRKGLENVILKVFG